MLIAILDDNQAETGIGQDLLEKGIPGSSVIHFGDELKMFQFLHQAALQGNGFPDLILAELHIPGLDSWQLVQDLKECAGTRETPIAFYTKSKNPKNYLFASRLNVPLFLKGESLKEKALAVHKLASWYQHTALASR